MMRVLTLALLAGCKGILGIDDPQLLPIDSAIEDTLPPDIVPIDSLYCYGTIETYCFDAPPTGILTFAANAMVDTSMAADCTMIVDQPGGSRCVIAAGSFSIPPTGGLVAIGTRPLVLIAADDFSLGGTLNVASRTTGNQGPRTLGAGGNHISCLTPIAPGTSGGAGGSFRSRGGAGRGQNAAESIGSVVSTDTGLRGGCPGGRGQNSTDVDGGNGGGAVLVIANKIEIPGSINASGGGGQVSMSATSQTGGGGGGSGGAIILDAPMISVSGVLLAVGGGGAEGAGQAGIERGGEVSVLTPTQPAPGGADGDGGDGGDGSLNGTGGNGSSVVGGTGTGGGGGGGGVGLIRIVGGPLIGGTVRPTPI